MANTKSAVKRARQNREQNLRNRHYRSRVRTAVKGFQRTLDEGPEQSEAALRKAMSELDRAASKGVIHPNAARRKKSRLARLAGQSQAGDDS